MFPEKLDNVIRSELAQRKEMTMISQVHGVARNPSLAYFQRESLFFGVIFLEELWSFQNLSRPRMMGYEGAWYHVMNRGGNWVGFLKTGTIIGCSLTHK